MNQELARLELISLRLAKLNETLRAELSASKRNSEESALLLENSKTELSALRNELDALRSRSSELARTAESSATDLRGLRTALSKAEDSLRSSEASFAAYRKEAEGRIRSLERESFFTRVVALIASFFAVSGWTAFFIMMLF